MASEAWQVTELPTTELGFHPCQGNLTTSYPLLVPVAKGKCEIRMDEGSSLGEGKAGPQEVGSLVSYLFV